MIPLTHKGCEAELTRLREENTRLRLMNEGLIGRIAACAEVLCAVAARREQYTPGELRRTADEARRWVCPYCKQDVTGQWFHEPGDCQPTTS